MSQPGRPVPRGRAPEPLRVESRRLTEEEARAAAAAPAPAPAMAGAATSTVAPTGPLPVLDGPSWGPWPAHPASVPSAAPVLAGGPLPVVASRPRRRVGDLWRLLFARRRAGRHRPETTPPSSWSMFAPQRRRRTRRWGRR